MTSKEHKRLLREIENEVRLTSVFTGRDHLDPRVLRAMEEVPREAFISDGYHDLAYDNRPLPIGHGQTISQPYIVALMTDLLELTPESTVLEIGTGSGYQAAILSRLAAKVYTIERVEELAEAAEKRLRKLGYNNVETRIYNGYTGWQEKAPFDAIIVTAAADHIPPPLIEQLKPGGRMVIPIGQPHMHQELLLITKDEQDKIQSKALLDVAFVPLISG